jgi:hypothetical protein
MASAVAFAARETPRDHAERFFDQLQQFWLGERRTIELTFGHPSQLAIGDPIFHQDANGQLLQIGEIQQLSAGGVELAARVGTADRATARLYATAPPFSHAAEMHLHQTPKSFGWVVKTLLPPERRQQVEKEIRDALTEHQAEILAALLPVVEQSVRDALAVVEKDLPKSLTRHRGELEALGAKYQDRVIRKQLVPLVRTEIWPIARDEADPLIKQVGRELWDELSLWRFGWRFLYDRSPLPGKQLTEQEWQRFVDENAIPILEQHADEFIELIQTIVRQVASNPRVRAELKRQMQQLMDDPALRAVLGKIAREVFIDNPRLHAVLRERWTSPEAQQAMELAGKRLEPAIRRIGDQLFGTRETGITPEFAAVLRSQVLAKDRRWLMLVDSSPELADPATSPRELRVELHETTEASPFVGRTFRVPVE